MSADRILTTHAGSLPRPDDLVDMIWAQQEGRDVDQAELDAAIDSAVAEVVAKQRDAGIDLVSDGEMSKTGFSTYVNERFSGFDGRAEFQADDVADFPNLAMRLFNTPAMAHLYIANPFGTGGFLANLFSTHPSVERRLRRLEAIETGRIRPVF